MNSGLKSQEYSAPAFVRHSGLIVEPMFSKILSLFRQIENLCRTCDLLLSGQVTLGGIER